MVQQNSYAAFAIPILATFKQFLLIDRPPCGLVSQWCALLASALWWASQTVRPLRRN